MCVHSDTGELPKDQMECKVHILWLEYSPGHSTLDYYREPYIKSPISLIYWAVLFRRNTYAILPILMPLRYPMKYVSIYNGYKHITSVFQASVYHQVCHWRADKVLLRARHVRGTSIRCNHARMALSGRSLNYTQS